MIRRIFEKAFTIFLTSFAVCLFALALVVLIAASYSGAALAGIGLGIFFCIPGFLCLFLIYRHKSQQRQIEQQKQQERDRVVREAEEAEAQRKRQHETEQESIRKTLARLESDTHGAVEILPTAISQAEAALDLATFEFREGAFVPFWDAVEKAVSSLKSYDDGIRKIASTSSRIPEELKKLDSPPRIDLSKLTWPDAAPTIKRMHQIVRQAQKNIEFTTIYLQRRTNGILVAGFANLGSAIEDMGSRIDGSIHLLTNTLDSAMASMANQNATFHQESLASMEAQREHEGKVEEMLDNIQRRRTPIPKQYRDGKY